MKEYMKIIIDDIKKAFGWDIIKEAVGFVWGFITLASFIAFLICIFIFGTITLWLYGLFAKGLIIYNIVLLLILTFAVYLKSVKERAISGENIEWIEPQNNANRKR